MVFPKNGENAFYLPIPVLGYLSFGGVLFDKDFLYTTYVMTVV